MVGATLAVALASGGVTPDSTICLIRQQSPRRVEFRPIIGDSVVLTLLNKGMLTIDDFVVELGAYRLKDERRKVFFTQFEERLNEEVIHPLEGTGALASKAGAAPGCGTR